MSTLLTPTLPPSLNSPDGVRLHVHHWPVAQPRGIVQMAHGMLEHLGRYQELAAVLNTAGWAVAGVDHRGHGQSSGERGAIREADDLLRDQAQLHDQLSRAYRHLPHVLLGSSLGGVVAARMAAELTQPSSSASWTRPLDGIVLVAPALEPTMSAPQRATLSVLSRLVPDLGIPVAHRPDWITSDPAVIAEINADKLIHHTITPRITQFMVSAARGVFERAPAWATPTLLMYSEIDRLVSAEACRRFHSLVPAHLMKTHAYHDMAHDLIHEPGRELVFEHLRNWLDSLS